jgi:hypothetical protein
MVDFVLLQYYYLRYYSTHFPIVQQIIFDVADHIFWCCSTCFFDVALYIFVMLQYIIFDVAVHIIFNVVVYISWCCTTYFCVIAAFIFRCLHYIVFPYVCEVPLEVFFCLGTVGKWGALGTGSGARCERRIGAQWIQFHSVLFCFSQVFH